MTLLAGDMSPFGDKKIAACILLLMLELFIDGAKSTVSSEIDNHLELGRELLASGQLSDALVHYHAAVEGDPSNYLTLFKRGTVYLALGKTRFALQDFTKVLELKADFTAARIQRGTVFFKSGLYYRAAEDFEAVLHEDPYNSNVQENYNRLQPAIDQSKLVEELIKLGDHKAAIEMLTQLLTLSPWSTTFRKARADCYIHVNDVIAAISDLRSVNKLSQDSTEGYYDIAELLYTIGYATSALKEIRECLKLDPEHKLCFPLYKKMKKVDKALTNAEQYLEEKKYADCITSAENVMKHEKEVEMIIFSAKKLLCTCLSKDEQHTKAIGKCKEALDIQKDAGVLCDRAASLIEMEMYDDAIHDYQDALRIDEHSQRASEGIERAKRLQKQSERRDYYKILNVKRSANKQEIIKAYRKAAQKWHPDNFKDDEKKVAEKKFIDIAAAKEVLTDPEKRQQFDNGEDPLDPENGRRSPGGNPFGHFHHGSPFQFKFHFN